MERLDGVTGMPTVDVRQGQLNQPARLAGAVVKPPIEINDLRQEWCRQAELMAKEVECCETLKSPRAEGHRRYPPQAVQRRAVRPGPPLEAHPEHGEPSPAAPTLELGSQREERGLSHRLPLPPRQLPPQAVRNAASPWDLWSGWHDSAQRTRPRAQARRSGVDCALAVLAARATGGQVRRVAVVPVCACAQTPGRQLARPLRRPYRRHPEVAPPSGSLVGTASTRALARATR